MADQLGRQLQHRVGVELRGEPLLGQLDAVALDAREADLQVSRSGRTALTWMVSRGGCGGATTGLAVKSNGMPRTSAYSTLNRPVLVEVVGLAAQRAADHLLAEELRAEGAHAEHVGDGVGVPALGEHRDRDDAADLLAEPAGLADGVHHLAQQVLVGDVLGLLAVAGALDDLAPEALDLVGGHGAEVVVQRLAGFELLAVDQQGVGRAERVAVLVEVAEQREAPVLQRSLPSSFSRWKPEM